MKWQNDLVKLISKIEVVNVGLVDFSCFYVNTKYIMNDLKIMR